MSDAPLLYTRSKACGLFGADVEQVGEAYRQTAEAHATDGDALLEKVAALANDLLQRPVVPPRSSDR